MASLLKEAAKASTENEETGQSSKERALRGAVSVQQSFRRSWVWMAAKDKEMIHP